MNYSYAPNQSNRRPKKRLGKKLVFLLLLLVLFAGGAYGAKKYWLDKKSTNKSAQNFNNAKANPEVTDLKGKYLFSGTTVLARAVERDAKGDYNQPFSGMDSLGKYDAGTTFFECPVTDGNVPFSVQVSNLKFNCKPEWLPVLKQYFPIINLSSNHVYDMGEDGFNETVKRLKEAGLQVVGNYNPHVEADNCKVVILPVRMQKKDGSEESAKLPIAFCSFNYKNLFSPEPGELESIERWAKIMPVFGLLNAGAEYQKIAGAQQMEMAHKMVDLGAEFVIANGTHWVQNSEVYKGKLIAYSMGNFIFDQIDYDGRIHLNISVEMTVSYDKNLAGWLELGASCKINSGSECRDQAESKGLTKFVPSFKFEGIGSYGGLREVARRANAQQQADIEQRANWPNTLRQLGQ